MGIIAKYKFNQELYANFIPEFNSGFTYTITDSIDTDGYTIRTIESNSLPTSMIFGASGNFSTDREKSLLEVLECNTDKINDMSYMFYYCSNLTSLDLSNFNTENVTDMQQMFYYCSELTSLDTSNFNTKKVTNMTNIFQNCSSLTSLDISSWDVSQCTTMAGMFNGCKALTSLDVSSWNFEKCTAINQFIRETTNLVDFNMSGVTFGATGVNFQNFAYQSGVQNVNMSNITTAGKVSFESPFYGCSKLKTIDFSNSHFKPNGMQNMFRGCSSLTSLDLSSWDTSQCTSMSSVFLGCSSLTSLDLSSFNLNEVTTTQNMFSSCTSLTDVKFNDLSFSNISNCADMFSNCMALTNIDLSSIHITKNIKMNHMFSNCPKLQSIKMFNCDGNVEMIHYAFNGCKELKTLDLSNLTIAPNTSVAGMFWSCKELEMIDLSNIRDIGDSGGIFTECPKLTTLGLLYSTSNTINKLASKMSSTEQKTIYYHDADASQLTPVDGVTFKKYQNQTTIQLPPHIQLHSLPDGTRDEVDIKTGILTQRVAFLDLSTIETWSKYSVNHMIFTGNLPLEGKTPSGPFAATGVVSNPYYENTGWHTTVTYGGNATKPYIAINATSVALNFRTTEFTTPQEMLAYQPVSICYELAEPVTTKLILNYNNSCDYGRILPTGMCDKYDVVNSMYTQTMTSILLDGENTWDAMEEFENTVKFTATGTTVGVENLNMLGSGGLYCDNDLFPNINDDSDVEHCRVDEEGNKFYIYVDKERLMSPDLIGWQIWLQTNPFNMWYELEEHLIYVKPYEELDATQARWEGMDCMRDGAIKYHTNNSDNITMYPTLEYIAPSINNFEVTMLEPNTEYTIYAEGINTNDIINLGGTDINFNNGTVVTSGDNQWLRIDNNDSFYNMVITKGDTTGEAVSYFEGMASVENPKVQCGESTVSYTDLKLRSLPNGVKDTINVVTGEYVQRVGEMILNGTEIGVKMFAEGNSLGQTMIFTIPTLMNTKTDATACLCDKITPFYGNIWNVVQRQDLECIRVQNEIVLSILKTKANTIDKLQEYLSENPMKVQYELAEPIITKLDPQTLLAYADGTINLSSDTGLLPTTHYSVPSTNTFNLASMKTGTRYTLKYPSASGSITIGDITYSISSNSMLFTTPLKINGDTSAIIFSDTNPENVILLEGAYNKREVPFFTGVKSVKNPNITIIDQLSIESTTYNCKTEIELRGLPNGVADKLDIIKGKLTTNVGIRPYQEGDENLPNIWTDGYETVYALSSPVVTNVTIDRPTVTTNSLIELSSDYLIPQLNYRAPSSNNFPLDLLQPNQTYTLYADTLTSGSYTLGGTKTGVYSQPHTITLGDMTDNLLTFNGDLGLSNVMLAKGNSLKTSLPPYFLGIRSVTDGHLLVEGMAGEMNELTFDEGIVLRDCNGVKDTIDLITCTLTKRTGEIKLTGAEGWFAIPNESVNAPNDYVVFALTLQGVDSSNKHDLICDTITSKYLYNKPHDTESIYGLNNSIRMCVKKSRIGGDTVNALKSWLNQNHTTVVYTLKTPLEVQLENTWTTLPPTSYNNQTEISSSVSNNSLKPMISVTIATTTLEEIVSNLEAQNAELENENIATMLALTDVYEMMCMSMPTTMNLSNEDLEEIEEEVEVTSMGMIYAKLIHKGLKTIDQVPYFLQREVKYALKQM